MLKIPSSLERLHHALQKLPFISPKYVQRIATHIVEMKDSEAKELSEAIEKARTSLKKCEVCFSFAQNTTLCTVCQDEKRSQEVICVVETWHDLCAIERAFPFEGTYHILGGALSPLEGIGPDDLHIEELVERLKTGAVKELIFATNPTPEGETTASYIVKKVTTYLPSLIISRIASGMPTGSSLTFMDTTTIHRALVGRKPF